MYQYKSYDESGFGTNVQKELRFLRKDGTFNVRKKGVSFFKKWSLYHHLINIHSIYFFSIIIGMYIVVNLLFASIYYFYGTENLGGIIADSEFEKFTECYFFSSQTLTTLGYGHVHPKSFFLSLVASFEAMIGVLAFAMGSGILYGRFSRPLIGVVFSKNILISPYQNEKALMFRIANQKNNEITDAEVSVIITLLEDENTVLTRKYYNLELERSHITFFATSWTIVHPLNENSPIHKYTMKEYEKSDIEVMVHFKGYSNTFSESIHTNASYKFADFVDNAKFSSIINYSRLNEFEIDFTNFNSIQKLNEEE